MQGRKTIVAEKGPLVLAALKSGKKVLEACDAAGVSYPAVLSWYKRGKAGEEKFVDFSGKIAQYMGNTGRPNGSKNKVRETHIELEVQGTVIRVEIPAGQSINIGSFKASPSTQGPTEQGITISALTDYKEQTKPKVAIVEQDFDENEDQEAKPSSKSKTRSKTKTKSKSSAKSKAKQKPASKAKSPPKNKQKEAERERELVAA